MRFNESHKILLRLNRSNFISKVDGSSLDRIQTTQFRLKFSLIIVLFHVI